MPNDRSATADDSPTTRRELPLYAAGIVVGMSNDHDVRRLYGNGWFRQGEGHGGGRYFVDKGRTVTLHAVIGCDGIIEYLSYARGLRLPGKPAPHESVLREAITGSLTTTEHLWLGARLGAPEAGVIEPFGKPTAVYRRGSEVTYRWDADHDTAPYVLYYTLKLHFSGGRLTAIELSNGC